MSWYATIRVTFGDDVKAQEQAEHEANTCAVVLNEQNTLNPNQIVNVEVTETGNE